jgi:LytS/YehU family sensor histidine kinase
VIFQALGVYFNLYFLIPRFLERGRYFEYISLLFITILSTAAFIVTGYYTSAWLSDHTFMELYGVDPEKYFHFFQINTLPSTVASTTLAMSVKLTKNWIQSKRREQALEKEKLETELKFLKSQFNPHFLFNTINSIFVLIDKNPRMASEALAKFSDILRYQLYECNEQQIPLDQELNYLENFIELQKLRQDHGNVEMAINTGLPHTGNLVIAPFILMPFVENAFKHVSKHRDEPNWIKMNLVLRQSELHLNVSNSTSGLHNSSSAFIHHRGIGLKNVRRRLDLLYPEKYSLSTDHDTDTFCVLLKVNLQHRKVPEPVMTEV